MKGLHRNVWILTMAQAMMMSASSLVVFIGGIVGSQLAPYPSLATLPAACIILGTAIATIPVALLMKKFGRKLIFQIIIILSILLFLAAGYALIIESFNLFCATLLAMGCSISTINQFRFAAMESVSASQIPQAASTVLIGGIAAAYIGPEIAVLGKNVLSTPYAGSLFLMTVLYAVSYLIIWFYRPVAMRDEKKDQESRPLSVIIRQSIFWVAVLSAVVGYAVMSFIMTATPISMHVMDGHSLGHTKWVIQSHIVAMFLPSLIVSQIIRRIGSFGTMILGIAAFGICLVFALFGHELMNYWVALILLGIGWNFLFIGGTTLLPRSYESSERFKVQALNDFLVFGSQAIAALSAGWVIFSFGWESMLWMTVPLLIIPILAILYHRFRNKT